MGGPWRARDFDPRAWRPPTPQVAAHAEPVSSDFVSDHLTGIVVGYIAGLVTSAGVVLGLMKLGW